MTTIAHRRVSCRHYDPATDFCSAHRISAPDARCLGCDLMEPHAAGIGDVVEKVLDVATLGLAKKAAKAKKGGCGCKKRRAALNRLTGEGAGE